MSEGRPSSRTRKYSMSWTKTDTQWLRWVNNLNYVLRANHDKGWHRKPQNTQAIIWISYEGIAIDRGWMNAETEWELIPCYTPTHPAPSPSPLVNVQLDKQVFDEALGAHMLPFQSCFHNNKAQFYQSTLTKLYQTEPLIPLQRRESHPGRPLQTNSFPPAVTHHPT